jgi:hypothetical protein
MRGHSMHHQPVTANELQALALLEDMRAGEIVLG